MIIIKQNNQLIVYEVDLSNELDPMIGQCQLNLLLKVPMSHISTEITTGFPNLMASDRLKIKQFITQTYAIFSESYYYDNKFRPLRYLDEYVEYIEKDLRKIIEMELKLELESISIYVFADVYQSNQQSIPLNDN